MVHKKRDETIESGFKYTGALRPFPYSFVGKRSVPDTTVGPDYAKTGAPNTAFQQLADNSPPVHTAEDIKFMRAACIVARGAQDAGHAAIAPGVTTEEVDRVVHEYIIAHNGYPSPLNYYNFPRSCCTSVNECICHGIPDTRPLVEGDIVNLDISCYVDGYHADMNETYCVGKVEESSRALIEATYDSLMKAI
jgi:methionyl aminopeptidase